MNPAYVLIIDAAAETALRAYRSQLGERCKVRVRNSSEPHDEMLVDAWWSSESFGLSFNYMDGDSGDVVHFGPETAGTLLHNKK